jgi:dipeptide/tripeptide permease
MRCLGDGALEMILLLQMLEAFAYYTLNNVLTLHLTSVFGISDTAAGAHFGVRGALTTAVSTLFGPVIDRVGAFHTLPIAFALAAVGRAVFGCASTLQVALASMYLPMAAGHGLTNATLIICIKRASSQPGGPSSAWAFALQYSALVLGIAICGPTIDVATARLAPSPPYRMLALLSSCCSVAALFASLLLLRHPMARRPTPSLAPKAPHSRASSSISHSLRGWTAIACTSRFARYIAFSVAVLPGCAVLRNLDGGIYPKFMLRTFGPTGTSARPLDAPRRAADSQLLRCG